MKKVLFILTLVLTLLLPCTQNVYADEEYSFDNWCLDNGFNFKTFNTYTLSETNYQDVSSLVSSGYDAVFIRKVYSHGVFDILYMFNLDNSQYAYYNSDSGLSIPYVSNGIYIYGYETRSKEGIGDNLTGFHQQNFINSGSSPYIITDSSVSSEILYSSFDIYTDSTGTDIFFLQTPLPPAPALPEIILEVEMNPLKEILTILPMVIPCWVGFVALRKALRLLATILRTA